MDASSGSLNHRSSSGADAGRNSIIGKTKVALHAFDDGRQSFTGDLSIGFAELYSLNLPISIMTRLRSRLPDDHANEGFTMRFSVPDGFRDRRFEFRNGDWSSAVLTPPPLLRRGGDGGLLDLRCRGPLG
jgi:hypothetical protein